MSKAQRQYKLRPGRSSKLPVETIGESIDKILEIEGTASAEMIHRYAAEEDHPLHEGCTWDDSVAGYNWRLQEIREMVTCYVAVEIMDDGTETELIANVSIIDDEGERAYANTFEVLPEENTQEQFLHEACGVLRGIVNRYSMVDSCKPIVQTCEKLLRKYEEPVAV